MARSRLRGIRPLLVVLVLSTLAAGGYAGYEHQHLLRAALSYRRGDWGATRQHAIHHLAAYPSSQWGLLLLARSCRQLHDWDAAERLYEQMDWVPIQDLRERAERYGGLRQQARLQPGERQMDMLERIRQIDPHDVENLSQMAYLYLRHFENPNQARILFGEITRLAPERVDGWVGLAASCVELGEHETATDCYRTAIGLNPPFVWNLHTVLGDMLLSSLGEIDAAAAEFRQALAMKPSDLQSLCSLASCYLEGSERDVAAARALLYRALEIDPQHRRTLLMLGELDLEAQDWDSAINRVAPLLGRDPNDVGAQNIHTRALRREAPVLHKQRRSLRVAWRFTEISGQLGVTFRHTAGENTQKRYFPETLGSGVAIFDYDGDGRVDLYFLNYNYLGPEDPQRLSPRYRNTLYRSLGGGSFEDVTDASGLGDNSPSHGVTIGDMDNDGDPDVYVANYGPNKLFVNHGDGTFTEIAERAGVSEGAGSMSTSAVWFDYDNDGDLDLYVCNYSIYDVYDPLECKHGPLAVYCGPDSMPNQRDTLYRNNGDGTFSDVTDAMGIGRQGKMGKGLGVVAVHLDGNDGIDLVVANDSTPNFVFLGDGTRLSDFSEKSGAHANEDGDHEACMGVDAGDLNGDGLCELIFTNQWTEKNTIYSNHNGFFEDASARYGVAAATKRAVGWGTGFYDFDRDGDLDHFVTNGHFYDWREKEAFRQKAMLWSNTGSSRFESVGEQAGPFFEQELVGRAAAFGDLDDDGDVDIVLNHWNEPCAVLRNDTQSNGAWIRLDLVGEQSNRDAIGTRVEVHAGERVIYRQVKGGGSYLSDHDPRLHLGLGLCETVDRLVIRWPSGQVREYRSIGVDRSYRIVEGRGLQGDSRPLAAQ